MFKQIVYAVLVFVGGALALLRAQAPGVAVLQIRADQVAAQVSPQLYGLMTEEINYSSPPKVERPFTPPLRSAALPNGGGGTRSC